MDAHEDNPRIQILSVYDTGRRRRWTDDEKIRIVEESHREGMTLAEVARRHEISRSMLYDWRYRHKLGLLGAPMPFMRLVTMDCGAPTDGMLSSTTLPPPVMTIDLGEQYRITIICQVDFTASDTRSSASWPWIRRWSIRRVDRFH
jgi:transposase